MFFFFVAVHSVVSLRWLRPFCVEGCNCSPTFHSARCFQMKRINNVCDIMHQHNGFLGNNSMMKINLFSGKQDALFEMLFLDFSQLALLFRERTLNRTDLRHLFLLSLLVCHTGKQNKQTNEPNDINLQPQCSTLFVGRLFPSSWFGFSQW